MTLARSYAEGRSMPLGQAVSELVRKGLSVPVNIRKLNGIAVFDLPPDSPPITNERVKEIEFDGE
jgi:hypothetical protein